jgi:hypothetical protein
MFLESKVWPVRKTHRYLLRLPRQCGVLTSQNPIGLHGLSTASFLFFILMELHSVTHKNIKYKEQKAVKQIEQIY